MASDSPAEAPKAAAQTRRLAQALDAIEAQLDALELGAHPDVVAKALAEPIRRFDAAAREVLR
jgi:hypothetical protein